jgi:hypothetical protein
MKKCSHKWEIVMWYTFTPPQLHCNENPVYVFLFWKLRGLSPNIHINVSVSDLYIPRIGLHIVLQQNRHIDYGNILIVHRHMNAEIGTGPRNSFSGNMCLKFSVLCLSSVTLVQLLSMSSENCNFLLTFKDPFSDLAFWMRQATILQ